jgi:hypothetical protein
MAKASQFSAGQVEWKRVRREDDETAEKATVDRVHGKNRSMRQCWPNPSRSVGRGGDYRARADAAEGLSRRQGVVQLRTPDGNAELQAKRLIPSFYEELRE